MMSGNEMQEAYSNVISWTNDMLPAFGMLVALAALTLGIVAYRGLR